MEDETGYMDKFLGPHDQHHSESSVETALCKSVLFTELSHHVLVVVGASTCTRLCMLVT